MSIDQAYAGLEQWIEAEKGAGAPDPQQAVLCTLGLDDAPHSRLVAIRTFSKEQGLLFFTQAITRKVAEIAHNPQISLNFWFELSQRQITIEGQAEKLSIEENTSYWQAYSRFSKLRFCAYAPTSSQSIPSKQTLEEKKRHLEAEFEGLEIPLHPLYCGFRILPKQFLFYSYRTDELSDVRKIKMQSDGIWISELISP